MKRIDFDQKTFILKQYKLLSDNSNKYYKAKDLDNLQAERIRLGEFVYTVEQCFNIDFYKWIETA